MEWKNGFRQAGVPAALGAALLFGAGTPLAKWLLDAVSPWMLAGLLYLGSGLGLALYRRLRRAPPVRLATNEAAWLAGAILAGGIVGPVLLMFGLTGMPASGASLLLNAEGVFTALLAWFAFKENFDRRIALGMGLIVAGALILSWSGEARFSGLLPTLAILGACLAWGIDNNLTRKVAAADASFIAMVKGLVAGTTNVSIALLLGSAPPAPAVLVGGGLVGLLGYGLSLVLFVVALRHLGTARTGAYFSVAPFFGAAVSVPLLGEPVDGPLLAAGALMALGVWLHVSERHAHAHTHQPLQHAHEHLHRPEGNDHHDHAHRPGTTPTDARGRHSHPHAHEAVTHSHPHFPDLHHRHPH